MKSKDRKPVEKYRPTQMRAEKKAVKTFYADLQKAIDGVDWGRVKVVRGRG